MWSPVCDIWKDENKMNDKTNTLRRLDEWAQMVHEGAGSYKERVEKLINTSGSTELELETLAGKLGNIQNDLVAIHRTIRKELS